MSKDDISQNARRMFVERGLDGEFVASTGWVRKFLKRNGLSSRRVTGHAQKVPENASVMCRALIDQVHSLVKTHSELTLCLIYVELHLLFGSC